MQEPVFAEGWVASRKYRLEVRPRSAVTEYLEGSASGSEIAEHLKQCSAKRIFELRQPCGSFKGGLVRDPKRGAPGDASAVASAAVMPSELPVSKVCPVMVSSVWPLAARERNGSGAEECAERSRSGASRAKGQTEAARPCAPPLQPVTSARGARWAGWSEMSAGTATDRSARWSRQFRRGCWSVVRGEWPSIRIASRLFPRPCPRMRTPPGWVPGSW